MKLIQNKILLAGLMVVALCSGSCTKDQAEYADTVELTRVKKITYDSAICVGYVTGINSETGIWFAAASTPESGQTIAAPHGSSASFEIALSGLDKGASYVVRTYAVCNGETVYSPQKSFTTLRDGEPQLRMTEPSTIGNTSVTLDGYVMATGGKQIISRGFCYGKTEEPTLETGTALPVSGDIGHFTAQATDLEDGVTYYARVYVENQGGVFYSDSYAFSTVELSKPIPTVRSISGLGTATMTVTAHVETTNDLPITERGIRYSLTEDFDTGTDVAAATSGKGEYQVSVSGLDPNELYNVWAYAVNRKGKVYSDMMTVKASIRLDKVNALSRSFTGDLTIINLGALEAPVTETGVCWSTTPSPTINNSRAKVTADGTISVGAYTTESDYGMTPQTKYYFRAYAINQYGCSYSTEQAVTTRKDLYDSQIRTGATGGKLPYFQGWQIILNDVTNAANSNVPEEALSPAFREIYAGLERACSSFGGAFMNGVIYRVRPTTDGNMVMQFTLYYRTNPAKSLTSSSWNNIQFTRNADGTFRFLQYKKVNSGIYTTNTPEGKAAIDQMFEYFMAHDFYFEWSTADYQFSSTLDNSTGPIRLVPVDAPEDFWTFTAKTYTAAGDISAIANPF